MVRISQFKKLKNYILKNIKHRRVGVTIVGGFSVSYFAAIKIMERLGLDDEDDDEDYQPPWTLQKSPEEDTRQKVYLITGANSGKYLRR